MCRLAEGEGDATEVMGVTPSAMQLLLPGDSAADCPCARQECASGVGSFGLVRGRPWVPEFHQCHVTLAPGSWELHGGGL